MTTRFLAVALAAALALAVAPAGAQADERLAKAVSFADLNLDRSADGAILLGRIVDAADEICEQPRSWRSLGRRSYNRCFRGAVQRAVDRVGEPTVTDAYLDQYRWAAAARPMTLAQR